MHKYTSALVAIAPLVFASNNGFSVHDDLLAFPQYEVVFSDSFISDTAAKSILNEASSSIHTPPQSSNTELESQYNVNQKAGQVADESLFDPAHETYELMYLHGEQHLCTIPIVDIPVRNETSEAEAKAAEQKELARATDRGWELLQDLEGNCLYFVSGWWSYAFCYNSEIVQFHQLPPQQGKPQLPPVRDESTTEFVLGRVKKSRSKSDKSDEWGNEVSTNTHRSESSKTEIQVKGDSRYLVQKMDGGTTCDLTGKPRRVEVQFHCSPQLTDRIQYIKELTTCSYLMVIYTPRLCKDIAFMPPKPVKANPIVCRVVVPASEVEMRTELASLEDKLASSAKTPQKVPISIGGVVVGGGKWINTPSVQLPIPANFNNENFGKQIEIIARAKSKAEGGQVEIASDADLQKMDLDPEMVDQLRREVQKMAKEKGWKIEVVDQPGEVREILGIVDGDSDGSKEKENGLEGEGVNNGDGTGSEEAFKEEL